MSASTAEHAFRSTVELKALLREMDQFQVVGMWQNPADALEAIREEKPDVILLDVHPLARSLGGLVAFRRREAPSARDPELSRIPCAISSSLKLVSVADVQYVKSTLAGVYVVTSKGEFYTELTLTSLEAKANLVRCHKQYLINFDRIDEIDMGKDSLAIRTLCGAIVPVSRRYLKRLRQLLGIGRVRTRPAAALGFPGPRRRMLATKA